MTFWSRRYAAVSWSIKLTPHMPLLESLINVGQGTKDLVFEQIGSKSFKISTRCKKYNLLWFFFRSMKHPNKLSFLDYKIVVAKNLIQYHQGWKGAVPILRPSKTKNQPDSIHNHGGHLPYYQTMRKQSTHSAMGGKEKRTFIICLAFKILLCLVKERNCLQKYHIYEYK